MKRFIPEDLQSFKQSKLYPFLGISEDLRVVNWNTRSLVNPSLNGGYLKFSIRVDGSSRSVLLHRLVAERFVPSDEDIRDLSVNHIDGNKLNNSPDNLEWVTLHDNNLHANATGLRDSCKGAHHHNAKNSEELVSRVCSYMSLNLSNMEVELLLGLPKGFCNDIRRGRRWKDISSKYNIPVKFK